MGPLYLLFLLSFGLTAQDLIPSPSVLSDSWHTAGGTVQNEMGSMAFTVGQIYHELSITERQGSVQKSIQRAFTDTTKSEPHQDDQGSITLYPNPFTDHFVIKFMDGPYGFSNFRLFD